MGVDSTWSAPSASQSAQSPTGGVNMVTLCITQDGTVDYRLNKSLNSIKAPDFVATHTSTTFPIDVVLESDIDNQSQFPSVDSLDQPDVSSKGKIKFSSLKRPSQKKRIMKRKTAISCDADSMPMKKLEATLIKNSSKSEPCAPSGRDITRPMRLLSRNGHIDDLSIPDHVPDILDDDIDESEIPTLEGDREPETEDTKFNGSTPTVDASCQSEPPPIGEFRVTNRDRNKAKVRFGGSMCGCNRSEDQCCEDKQVQDTMAKDMPPPAQWQKQLDDAIKMESQRSQIPRLPGVVYNVNLGDTI